MGLKDYFAFSKRQRNGIIVLLTIILGMMIYLIISDYLPPSPASVDFSSFKGDMAKVKFKQSDTTKQIIVKPAAQTDKSVPTKPIELNSADSADFMKFPSVSPKVARTIVRFRNALGGYYSKEQLLEVYGLDSACYNAIVGKITVDISQVEKMDINKATEKELTHHPYIHKKLAKAIVGYRKENGHFTQLSDIMKVEGIDGDLYEKLSHYLSITK
ncbi:MAG TPA: helix-hairpin-helix domain-containing protein [Bacteroidia bacterium]|jgi:competence ComEA-like helix-hairpin-helix protein|nr:helix-hairpin-helix domain-containing protein [Bacteroidia bacterium]